VRPAEATEDFAPRFERKASFSIRISLVIMSVHGRGTEMARPKVNQPKSRAGEIAESLKRERPDLDPTDYLYLLYAQRVGRILEIVDDRHCRSEYGVSASDMRVLYALRRAGSKYTLRPTELFRSLLVTSGAITKQVDRLAAMGHVDRIQGPPKSGGFLIRLTAKGKRTADQGLTSLVHSSVASINRLTRAERGMLCVALEKVLLDLEERLRNSPAKTARTSKSKAPTPKTSVRALAADRS
jgi:DNA-binding MarR family transcriptional regulator